jgi:hypothetical protein
MGRYSNFLLVNKYNIEHMSYNEAVENFQLNKNLLFSIFPVYKHVWSNAILVKNESFIELTKKGNSLSIFENFNHFKLLSHDEKNCKLVIHKQVYTCEINTYAFILFKNFPVVFNLENIELHGGELFIKGLLYEATKNKFLTKIINPKDNKLPLISLLPEIQEKIFEIILNRKNCVVTGSTGAGKSSQIPKIIWWIVHLFDGFNYFENKQNIPPFFNKEGVIKSNNVVIGLPRKVLIRSLAERMWKELGYKKINGSPVDTLFRYEAGEKEKYSNKLKSGGQLIYAVHRLFLEVKNINCAIIDEYHEHDVFSIISISLLAKKKLRSIVIMTATLEDDRESILAFLNDVEFVDIASTTRFNIETRCYPNLNYESIIKNLILKNEFNIDSSIIIFQSSKRQVDTLENHLSNVFDINKNNVYNIVLVKAYSDLPNLNNSIREAEKPNPFRTIFIGTPILESSITIEKAVAVIDSCQFYMKHFRTGYTVEITMNMQIQRKGRVGRTRDGIYICEKIIKEKSSYKKIDHEYLWPYVIYGLKYGFNLDDLIIKPRDMTRFEKSINYLEKKKIDIKNEIINYYQLYNTYPCNLIEYLRLYKDNSISDLAQFDEAPLKYKPGPYLINEIIKRTNLKLNVLSVREKSIKCVLYGEFEDPSNNYIYINDEDLVKKYTGSETIYMIGENNFVFV